MYLSAVVLTQTGIGLTTHVFEWCRVYSDGPVVDLDFTPTTDSVGLCAMGTPSEFDRRKKKK